MAKLLDVFRKNLVTQIGNTSLREFSKRTNVAHPTLGRILNGEANPNLETIETMADSLEIPAWQLLRGPGERDYEIPQDILAMLDGQSPAVYSAIRSVLESLTAQRSKPKKKKA